MATIDTIVTPILKVEAKSPQPLDPVLLGEPGQPGEPGPPALADSAVRALVTVRDADAVILDPSHPRYRLYRRILQGFAADQNIAFLDVDRDTRALTTLAVPTTGGIGALDEEPDGDVFVQLVGSSRIFILKPAEPDFIAMRDTLRDAVTEPAVVSVRTKPFSDEIVDVRRVGPFEGPQRTEGLLFGDALVATLTPVSESVARKLFDFLAADICDPGAILQPCMPFEFPDDGCQGRAHVMCEKLSTASQARADLPDVLSGKIWRHGDLNTTYEVRTPNSPTCTVNWLFHCAPLIRLTDGTRRVLDPSLFTEPRTPEEWEARQTTNGTRLTITDKVVYYRRRPDSPIFFDRLFDHSRVTIGAARASFDERVEDFGPPPYCRA